MRTSLCSIRPQCDRAHVGITLEILAQSLLLTVSRGVAPGPSYGGPEATESPSARTRRLLDIQRRTSLPSRSSGPPPAGRGLEVKHEGQAMGSARTRGDGICLRSPREGNGT